MLKSGRCLKNDQKFTGILLYIMSLMPIWLHETLSQNKTTAAKNIEWGRGSRQER